MTIKQQALLGLAAGVVSALAWSLLGRLLADDVSLLVRVTLFLSFVAIAGLVHRLVVRDRREIEGPEGGA